MFRRKNRKGTATIELAIAMPLMLILIFFALQTVSAIFLKQSLLVASYEGARSAIESGSTTAEVTARCQQVLDEYEIENATITTFPTVIEDAVSEDPIEVHIEAPYQGNTFFGSFFLFGTDSEAMCVMMKE